MLDNFTSQPNLSEPRAASVSGEPMDQSQLFEDELKLKAKRKLSASIHCEVHVQVCSSSLVEKKTLI
eukprot:6183586-Pleurochrysis_carterae.AAC.2